MAASVPSENHIRYPLHTFSFIRGMRWFRRFAAGNYDLTDRPQDGRSVIFDNDILESVMEADTRLYKNYAETLGPIYKDVYTKLKRHIDKK